MKSDSQTAIWNWAVSLDGYVIQSFALAVTGIGALFFAYGEILNTHVRLVISATGVLASVVLFLHTRAALGDREAALDYLRQDPGSKELMRAHDAISRWRHNPSQGWAYFPVAHAILTFSALLALAWGLLLVTNLGYSWTGRAMPGWAWDESIFAGAVIGAAVWVAYQKYRASQKAKSQEQSERKSNLT